MSTILPHMRGLNANLRCMCEMCCTQLAENAGPKKIAKNSPCGPHRTTMSGYIFAKKACIDDLKKPVKQHYLPHLSLQYGELRPTSGWDLLASLGHPSRFQWVSRLGTVTVWQSGSGHQPNYAALNRGRHLYVAGQPSRWTLAHILVGICLATIKDCSSRVLHMRLFWYVENGLFWWSFWLHMVSSAQL